jgi:tol-pal system protein YbgF
MSIPTPRGAFRAWLALAALLSVSGCATKGDLRTVSNDIRALSARQDSILAELRYQSSVTQDTLRTTVRDLFQIRGELVRRLTTIQEDLDRLTELTGESQRGIASLRDQMDAARRGGAPTGGALPGGGGVTDGGTAADLYTAAVSQYERGQFQTARMAFQDFLSQYPSDVELAPHAHFYLAEILIREERLDDAIREFLVIRENFPLHEQVPDALYRVGLLHRDRGDTAEARRYLELVINTYPDNQEVTPLAREALRDLGGSV